MGDGHIFEKDEFKGETSSRGRGIVLVTRAYVVSGVELSLKLF